MSKLVEVSMPTTGLRRVAPVSEPLTTVPPVNRFDNTKLEGARKFSATLKKTELCGSKLNLAPKLGKTLLYLRLIW